MGWVGKSTTVLKIAVVCLLVVYILVIVGFVTTHWSVITRKVTFTDSQLSYTYKAGLWQECSCMTDTCACIGRQNTPGWFKAIQALMTMAVIGLTIALILSCLFLCVTDNRKLKIFNIVLIVLSGIFIVISVILYGTKSDQFNYEVPNLMQSLVDIDTTHEYGYSYILCYVADAIIFLACISLFIWDLRSRARDRTEVHHHVHHYRREPHVEVMERSDRPQLIYAPSSYAPYASSSYAPPSYHSNYSNSKSGKPGSHVNFVEPYGNRQNGMEQPSYKPQDQWSFNVLSDRMSSKRY